MLPGEDAWGAWAIWQTLSDTCSDCPGFDIQAGNGLACIGMSGCTAAFNYMNEARADDGDWSAAEFEKAKLIALTYCLQYDCGDGNNLTKSEHYEGLAAAWGAVLAAPTGSQLLRASQLAASRQLLTGTSLLDDTLSLADDAARLTNTAPRTARLSQDVAVNPRAPAALPTNRSVGRASHNQALQSDIANLPAGATDIRVNQQQVNAAGQRAGINRPDLQYTVNGQRYYIEYEGPANPRGPAHTTRITANDPTAIVTVRLIP